jgi:hypothetical protein
MPRYIAALCSLAFLILCGALWRHGNTSCDTYVMPLLPPWSVRFHNFAGRQVLQVIPEYNSLSQPLFTPLRISYDITPVGPRDIAWHRANSRPFVFEWRRQNYQFGLPCWFTITVLGTAIVAFLFAPHLWRARNPDLVAPDSERTT